MKTTIFASAVLLLGASSLSFAQTCASPVTMPQNANLTGSTGTFSAGPPASCVAAAGVEPLSGFALACGAVDLTGPTYVYRWTYNGSASRVGSITITPADAFNVAIFTVPTSCTGTASCAAGGNADSGGGGAAESVNLTGGGFAAAGTYYFLVTSTSDGSAAQGAFCGSFTGAVGLTPVSVQSFSVD